MTKPAIFVYGPRASGKTYNAKRIADIFGITHDNIVDEFDVARHIWQRGRLYLTNNFAHELPRGDAIRIPISAFSFAHRDAPTAEQIETLRSVPEWGEPIPTPGDSCPEWLTLDDIKDGYVFTDKYGCEKVRDRMRPHAAEFESWLWDNILNIKLRPHAPAYAKVAALKLAEQVSALEAAGYTVTPPASPEPDYEAYREKLTAYLKGKCSDRTINGGDRLSGPLTPDDREMIRGLIAVGVKP